MLLLGGNSYRAEIVTALERALQAVAVIRTSLLALRARSKMLPGAIATAVDEAICALPVNVRSTFGKPVNVTEPVSHDVAHELAFAHAVRIANDYALTQSDTHTHTDSSS
jgi:hypothetical protein